MYGSRRDSAKIVLLKQVRMDHQNDFFQDLPLPGDGSLEALTAHVEMAAPADLTAFLSGFQVWLKLF